MLYKTELTTADVRIRNVHIHPDTKLTRHFICNTWNKYLRVVVDVLLQLFAFFGHYPNSYVLLSATSEERNKRCT